MCLQIGAGRTEKGVIADVRQTDGNRWSKILKEDTNRGGKAKDLGL